MLAIRPKLSHQSNRQRSKEKSWGENEIDIENFNTRIFEPAEGERVDHSKAYQKQREKFHRERIYSRRG